MLSYRPRQFHPSLSHNDRAAIAWLKANAAHITVADTDKNLGDALLPRSWIRETSVNLLNASCIRVDQATCNADMYNTQAMVTDTVNYHQSAGDITSAQGGYIVSRCGSTHIGGFRLRPKIHKEKLEARPVFNFTGSWILPVCIFLCDALAPVQNALCPHAVQNTDDVQARLSATHLPSLLDLVLLVIDIKNLYPSIDQDLLLRLVVSKVNEFYANRKRFALLVCNLLKCVVRSQHVCFENQNYKALVGIGTGIPCGTFLANIMLSFYDEFLVHSNKPVFFCRNIDDCLAITERDKSVAFLNSANSWQPCIVNEFADEPGSAANYLDLTVTLLYHNSKYQLGFSIFRKPLNKYMYLPRSSCHAPGTFFSICFGEALRILRRCSSAVDVRREFNFLTGKLVAKGYSNEEIGLAISKACAIYHSNSNCSRSVSHRVLSVRTSGTRKAFLKLKHSSSINYTHIHKLAHKLRHLHGSKLVVAKTVQHSMFRMLYPHMWGNVCHQLEAGG